MNKINLVPSCVNKRWERVHSSVQASVCGRDCCFCWTQAKGALLYIWWLLEKPVQRKGKKDVAAVYNIAVIPASSATPRTWELTAILYS